MKKLWLIMLTLILFFVVSNHAQGKTTWTRVTSIDQIESGKIYMLAAYSTSGDKSNGDMNYINYFKPYVESGYLYNEAINISATKIPSTIVTDSTKQYLSIILTQETNGWTVYNTTTHKYNGYSTGNIIDESDLYSATNYWTVNFNDNKFVEIENKRSPGLILGYKIDKDTKQLRVYSKTGTTAPILYKLTSYDLDESQDFKESDNIYQIPVTLRRSFTNDTYNSLVLPCEVNDYKAVFGSATTAYELSGYSNDNINFTTVIGNYLSANKPYIIAGTFNASPYKIGNVELNKISKPLSVSSDSKCSYIGNFSKTDLSGKDYYILCNNKFYPCGSQPAPFNILPYHCYFSLSESVKAKIAINGTETTDIECIQYDQKNNNDKYDMNGTKIEDITSYHGVYICNRHKYIR